MTRNKILLAVQSLLCVVLVVMLAASAVGIYRTGIAEKQENPLAWVYTREKAAAALKNVLPVFLLAVAVTVACAVLTLVVTLLFVTPKYESSAMFYVNNNSVSLGDAALSITSSDISASRGLVQSYIVILNTRESLNDVIDYTGVSRTYKELKEMISAEAVDDTEIFKVVVTSEDSVEAEKIANGIAYILPKRITAARARRSREWSPGNPGSH